MQRITFIFLSLSLLFFTSPCYASDQIWLPSEILEVSPPLKTSSSDINQIRYILLHHADAADREALSKWLKTHSGTRVRFMIDEKEYTGVLCRLAHCFGRGLLIHTADVQLKKGDIIDVLLSPPPKRTPLDRIHRMRWISYRPFLPLARRVYGPYG